MISNFGKSVVLFSCRYVKYFCSFVGSFILQLLLGVILISLALCADAVIGNVQEKAMVMYDAPNGEVVSLDKSTL